MNNTIQKKKSKKGLIVLLVIALLAGGAYIYYQNNLKPDPQSEYIGSWYDSFFLNPDGTEEAVFGTVEDAKKDPTYFNADGTYYYKPTGKDIWVETDEYILLVFSNTKFYKTEDGKLYIEFENDYPERGGEGMCKLYLEKF